MRGNVLRAVRGMDDILPERCRLLRQIIRVASDLVEKYGYREIRTPLVECADLFERSLGEDSDVVRKEMYTFLDRNNMRVALRPEGTASVVRAFLSTRLHQTLPQRLYYSGPMFRYERPQRGRRRQFEQFGIEYLGGGYGSSNTQQMNQDAWWVDTKVIELGWRVFECLGLTDRIHLHLNMLPIEEGRSHYRMALQEYLQQCKDKLSLESRERLERNSLLRILDSKDERDQDIIINAPPVSTFLSSTQQARWKKVQQALSACGISYCINEHLVRGLDYYSDTVFEFLWKSVPSPELGRNHGKSLSDILSTHSSLITVLAGGRYDTLVQRMSEGQVNVPGIGWALGVDRLVDMTLADMKQCSNEKNVTSEDLRSSHPTFDMIPSPLKSSSNWIWGNASCFTIAILPVYEEANVIHQVAMDTENDRIEAMAWEIFQQCTKHFLGNSEWISRTEYSVEWLPGRSQSLSKRLSIASQRLQANAVLLIGTRELQQNMVTIKNFATGDQVCWPLSTIWERLYEWAQNSRIADQKFLIS